MKGRAEERSGELGEFSGGIIVRITAAVRMLPLGIMWHRICQTSREIHRGSALAEVTSKQYTNLSASTDSLSLSLGPSCSSV